LVDFTFSPLLGIAGAAVLGGILGLQRQAAQKAAGFRTHLIVATAAAAFTAMGAHLHDTRIPSYIVVGIGFLGAGAIIRQGATAHGLTTAASIWMSAAIGLLLGYSNGFGLAAGVLATAITLGALSISDDLLMRLFHMRRKVALLVTCTPSADLMKSIDELLRSQKIAFESEMVSIIADTESDCVELRYSVALEMGRRLSAVAEHISAISGVRRVEASEQFFAG
jgi:putative Mg2+ transporter-C (MgtC) family protein